MYLNVCRQVHCRLAPHNVLKTIYRRPFKYLQIHYIIIMFVFFYLKCRLNHRIYTLMFFFPSSPAGQKQWPRENAQKKLSIRRHTHNLHNTSYYMTRNNVIYIYVTLCVYCSPLLLFIYIIYETVATLMYLLRMRTLLNVHLFRVNPTSFSDETLRCKSKREKKNKIIIKRKQ